MESQKALATFFNSALDNRWKSRYLSLIETKKGKSKFLKDLYHVFNEKIDDKKIVKNLSSSVLDFPPFSYSEIGGFGTIEATLGTAYEKFSGKGCLAIDHTGQYGIIMQRI